MATRKTMNVSLTPRLERFISRQVQTGRYRSSSEVVREGVRLLEERENERLATLEGLRKAVAVGLEAALNGELRDGEAFFQELELEERQRKSPGKFSRKGA